jgi:glutathionylspermidine synthase
MILSNKALLTVLWELFPHHPNLLPAFRSGKALSGDFVRKPLLSREGANITIVTGDGVLESDGSYGKEGYVYQAYHALPVFDGWHTVIGSWIIGGESAGIGIREDRHPITQNTSCFVPHFFR